MNVKRTIGIILILIGAIILIISLYARSRVNEYRKDLNTGTGFFPKNPINQEIGGALEQKIGSYDAPIMIGTIGGIVLVIAGIGTLLYRRPR